MLAPFQWPVDAWGYEIHRTEGDGTTLLSSIGSVIIRGRGGPAQWYRPIEEHPGLWRRFADIQGSEDGLLEFVNRFGLLGDWSVREIHDDVPKALETARLLSEIAKALDAGSRGAATDLYNAYAWPRLTNFLVPNDRKGTLDFRLVPLTLRSAMLLQAAETMTEGRQWRRCRNEGCPTWFQIGAQRATVRREFCSPRCRVASARRHKSGGAIHV